MDGSAFFRFVQRIDLDARMVELQCGCFYRFAGTPHRVGWRYRCWRHRLLAWLRMLPAGPDGGM